MFGLKTYLIYIEKKLDGVLKHIQHKKDIAESPTPTFWEGERPNKNYKYIYIVWICLSYYLCSLNSNYFNDTYNIT